MGALQINRTVYCWCQWLQVGALPWSVGRTDLPFAPGWRGEVFHMDTPDSRGYIADLGPRWFAAIIAASYHVCAMSCGYTHQKN